MKLNMKEQSTFILDDGNDTLLDYLDDYPGDHNHHSCGYDQQELPKNWF